jgi:SAM-dependent methyltransferase
MVDWQERITSATPPAIRTEHDVRYRLAAPLVASAGTWCDLGCGNGIAAAAALGDERPERIVLVDVDEPAVGTAAEELGARDAVTLAADLTDPDALERVRAAVLEGDGERVITCFEVVEHLATFVPLVELLTDLAEDHGVTVLLSVPNDAFTGVENPHHVAVWGAGAFEELRRLLPDGHVLAHQVALQGSAVVPLTQDAFTEQLPVEVPAEGPVPTHFLAAFGPGAAGITGVASVVPSDLEAQRAWERQREADVELVPALLETVRRQTKEFEDWRRYIHELEDKLGMPRSGSAERTAWDGEQAAGSGAP